MMYRIISIVCVLAVVIVGVFTRFHNPTMTETELLVGYWWLWLGHVAAAILAAYVWRLDSHDKW